MIFVVFVSGIDGRFNAGLYGLEENDKRTETSPCYALIVMLDGFVLERSFA